MSDLVFAKDLSLPPDAATQKFAFLGRSSSGKSYAAKRLVESLWRAGTQVVIFDSVGIWYGLRSGARPLDIPILGGLHGDVPLDPAMGSAVANLACDHGTSLVLDVSQMTDADRTRFATAFAHRFYERMKAAPRVVTLVLEECQEYTPENPQGGEAMMLHEFQRIAKIGRNFGIGLVLISQRPQEINKKALNQAECVVAFQMTGPHERKALTYWLSDRGIVTGLPLDKTLPTLEVGKPFIWSPQWLKVASVFQILPIETGDTSRTPTVGAAPTAPAKLSIIDIGNLLSEMSEAVVQAQESDPKFLRARIAELEKTLRGTPSSAVTAAPEPVWEFDKARAAQLVTHAGKLRTVREQHLRSLLSTAQDVLQATGLLVEHCKEATDDFVDEQLGLDLEEFFDTIKPHAAPVGATAPRAPQASLMFEPPELPTGEAAVLSVILSAKGGATKALIMLETKYKKSSVDTYTNNLRVRGMAHRSVDKWFATAEGFAAPRPLPSSPTKPAEPPKMRTQIPKVISQSTTLDESPAAPLQAGENSVLHAVFLYGKSGAPRSALVLMTGYKQRSVQNYIASLVKSGLVKRGEHSIVITDAGAALIPKGTKPYPKGGRALIEHLIQVLPDGESKVLGIALGAHPSPAALQACVAETGYKPRSIQNYAANLIARRACTRAGPGLLKIHHEVMK